MCFRANLSRRSQQRREGRTELLFLIGYPARFLPLIYDLKQLSFLDFNVFFCLPKSGIKKQRAINRSTDCSLFGDRAGIRTQDPQLRRLLLYPAELPDRPYFLFESDAKVVIYTKLPKYFSNIRSIAALIMAKKLNFHDFP